MKIHEMRIVVPSGLLLALMLAAPMAQAAEATPLADDACVAQCDDDADKCMDNAGGDESKEKACDDQYDKCLDKCG
jgi:hypothetical protein